MGLCKRATAEALKEGAQEPQQDQRGDGATQESPGTPESNPDHQKPAERMHAPDQTSTENGPDGGEAKGTDDKTKDETQSDVTPEIKPEPTPESCQPEQCPQYWFVQRGMKTSDQSAHAVTQDRQGNVYVTGQDNGNLFVAKLDAKGTFLWTFLSTSPSGTNARSIGYAIALDSQGHVIVAGQHGRDHEFDGKAYPLIGNSNHLGVIVLKLTSAGKVLWSRSAGGQRADIAHSVVVDAQDQIYISGYYRGKASFGTHSISTRGIYEGFVAKLDATGKWLWAQTTTFDGAQHIIGQQSKSMQLALTNKGHVFVAGHFSHTLKLGTSTLTPSDREDTFLAKISDQGKWLWASTISGQGDQIPHGILVDTSGAMYVLCSFTHEAQMGTRKATSNGQGDFVLAKLDAQGKWLWHKQSSGRGLKRGAALAFDHNGNLLVAGEFQRQLTLDQIKLTENNTRYNHPFVAKFDRNGKALWATAAYSPSGYTQTHGLAVDQAGTSIIVGQFANGMRLHHTNYHAINAASTGNMFLFKVDTMGAFLQK